MRTHGLKEKGRGPGEGEVGEVIKLAARGTVVVKENEGEEEQGKR